MEPNDVIERYDKKDIREQVDQMGEEEISVFAEQVAALASTIDDPSDAIARRVVSFFEQERISSGVRILGIRTLTKNMAGMINSEKLAHLLMDDIDNVPPSFWDQDGDTAYIRRIDVCDNREKLIEYTKRTDGSKRVRRAAAMKLARISTTEEDKEKFSNLAEALAPEEESE